MGDGERGREGEGRGEGDENALPLLLTKLYPPFDERLEGREAVIRRRCGRAWFARRCFVIIVMIVVMAVVVVVVVGTRRLRRRRRP